MGFAWMVEYGFVGICTYILILGGGGQEVAMVVPFARAGDAGAPRSLEGPEWIHLVLGLYKYIVEVWDREREFVPDFL